MSCYRTRILLILLLLACGLPGCRKKHTPPPPHPSSQPDSATQPAIRVIAKAPTSLPASQPAFPPSSAPDSQPTSIPVPDDGLATDTASGEPIFQPTTLPAAMESEAFLLGVEAMNRKDYPSAIQHLETVFAENPAEPSVLRALGQAMILDQKYDQAEPIYEMLTHLVPDDDIARFNLAVIHSRLWQFSQAEQCYRELLEKNPQANRVRYNLAAMYQIQGKLTQARDQWREIIRNAPELPSSYIALAEVEMQLNHPQAAVESYAQASQLLPKEVSIYLNLSTAAEAAGSYGLALAALKNARQVAPQDAEIYARTGQILLALHRQTEKPELLQQAISEWEKCLELDSSRQDIRDWLKTYRPLTSAPAETSTQPTRDEDASLPE